MYDTCAGSIGEAHSEPNVGTNLRAANLNFDHSILCNRAVRVPYEQQIREGKIQSGGGEGGRGGEEEVEEKEGCEEGRYTPSTACCWRHSFRDRGRRSIQMRGTFERRHGTFERNRSPRRPSSVRGGRQVCPAQLLGWLWRRRYRNIRSASRKRTGGDLSIQSGDDTRYD